MSVQIKTRLGGLGAIHFSLALLVVVCSALLLFARLGHYALWGDEAGTALEAKGVLRTFDTSALVDDHNIWADDNGELLVNLRERYLPPLQAYLTAPFLAVFGRQSAWAARLPFALCGLASIALILWWVRREQVRLEVTLLLCLGLLCNVSLFLYSRQCRYYAAALLCSLAVACLYLRWNGRRGRLIVMAVLSICLLASNYLNYAALYACLAADYAIWRRKEQCLAWRDWMLLFLPQIIAGVFLISIWNPFGKHVFEPGNPLEQSAVAAGTSGWLADRLTLFWWNWRDLNRCEFGALLLLGLAPLLYPWSRNRWLLRAPLALLVYVLVVTLCSPQAVGFSFVADVRYLVPLIPLCVAIEALVLWTASRKLPWVALPLAVLAFGTNVLNGGPLAYLGTSEFKSEWPACCRFRSTLASYIGELIHPPGDPYAVTARWINEHVGDGESIWVLPNPAAYPLMFHAPKAIYAWQLTDPPAPQFAHLPPIHFRGREAPDYIVVFGPGPEGVVNALRNWNGTGVRYQPVETIDHFWRDRHRPELFWRTFTPITNYDRNTEAIYVFKRVAPPASG